jgi:DNA modification methylase
MAKRKTIPVSAPDSPAPAATAPVGRIHPGDCLQLMHSWPAQSVDLIFADPPYNIGFKYDQYEDKRDDHEYVEWTQHWVSACARLLKPGGSIYILIGDEYAAETRLHLKSLERQRQLVFRNWIIWHYTFGQNCRTKLNRSHAHLLYAVGPGLFGHKMVGRGTGKYDHRDVSFTFNRDAVAVPSARQTTYADARANPTGKLPDDTWYLRPQEAIEDQSFSNNSYFDPEGDTWYLSRLCGTFKERQGWHPCQLPEALLERIVKLSSNEGDVVFDPFAGSGTTLAVAARLKRQWLGCELSDDYAARATERIRHSEATGETQLANPLSVMERRSQPKKKPEPHRSAGLFAAGSRKA